MAAMPTLRVQSFFYQAYHGFVYIRQMSRRRCMLLPFVAIEFDRRLIR